MKIKSGILFLISIITAVIFFRTIPHAPNFTPVGGVTLLGAAYFGRKYLAVIVPILAMWLSDLLLNNTVYAAYSEGFQWFASYQIFTFAAIAFTAIFGIKWFNKVSNMKIFGGAVVASLLFFIVTNFGTWMAGTLYAKTIAGLITCYVAAIPFLLNTLASNLVFGFALFYLYTFTTEKTPILRINSTASKSQLELLG